MSDTIDKIAVDQEKKELLTRIQHTLDKIRPYIQADGGDCELVGYDNGVVIVSMQGACQGCGIIDSTLNDGIKAILMDEIPEVKDVQLLETDDYSSFTPYY